MSLSYLFQRISSLSHILHSTFYILILLALPSLANEFTKIVDNSPDNNRVVFVITGDGFREQDQETFNACFQISHPDAGHIGEAEDIIESDLFEIFSKAQLSRWFYL